jgi:hypothetical protein
MAGIMAALGAGFNAVEAAAGHSRAFAVVRPRAAA